MGESSDPGDPIHLALALNYGQSLIEEGMRRVGSPNLLRPITKTVCILDVTVGREEDPPPGSPATAAPISTSSARTPR